MDEPKFRPDRLTERLSRFPALLATLVEGVSAEDARFCSGESAWSVVEVVSHLADEEEADFPPRLRALLEDPSPAWTPIDPERWARERDYLNREVDKQLRRFAAMREQNLTWLRSAAADADWERVKRHPLGDLRAGDLLAAWCDHDILHARQILKRLHELTQRDAGPYSTLYAGEWRG